MANESNLQIISSYTHDASPVLLKAGFSTVPTLQSLQKLRSELLRAGDLDEDDHIDMVKRSINDNSYIRYVFSPQFRAMLMKREQVDVLEKFVAEVKFRRGFIDATGNIIRPISGKPNKLNCSKI